MVEITMVANSTNGMPLNVSLSQNFPEILKNNHLFYVHLIKVHCQRRLPSQSYFTDIIMTPKLSFIIFTQVFILKND